jgi:hypothetical protein
MSILPRSTANVNPTTPNPRDSWPDWTDDYRWVPTPDADECRPSVAPYVPTAVEESFYRGFTLGLDGEDPVTPPEFPADGSGRVNRAFLGGLAAGRFALERERERIMAKWEADAEFERWVDQMEAQSDRFDLMSPEEIIECRGHHPSTPYDL